MGNRLGGWLVAAAAAVALLGVSIAPFLHPSAVRFEQDRGGVVERTGYSPTELDRMTAELLADLVLWQGDFDVDDRRPIEWSGGQILSEGEKAHMRDVRNVFTGFWLLVTLAAIVLVVTRRRARVATARAAFWRAVSNGARALAIGIAVAGVFALVAFDAAFDVFHRLFFSAGTYTFDSATSRLVQLFPMQFWSDIAIAVGLVVLVLSILTAWVAGRRARRVVTAEPVRVLSTSQVAT